MTPETDFLAHAREFMARRHVEAPLADRIVAELAAGPLMGSALRFRLGIRSEAVEGFYQVLVDLLDAGRIQTDPTSCTYYRPKVSR